MRHRVILATAAAALLSACASGGSAPGEAPADNPFRYDVPSPPTATYQIADTTTSIMSMPNGEMDMAMASSSTIELTFAADSGGVRATGTVSDYSATMSSSMMGNMEMGGDGVSGDLEFVIGPLGHVEMISMPEVAGGALPGATPFQFNAVELFPRFPGHPLEAGDTWADTTAASADLGALGAPGALAGSSESTTVYTYTLVGDTVVAGRTLQKITVSGIGTTQTSGEEAGEPVSQDMTNTLEGFVLWDADRGLVAVAELVRTVDGSMSMQGMAMATTSAGPVRLRLVN